MGKLFATRMRLLAVCGVGLTIVCLQAQQLSLGHGLQRREFQVAGVVREALVYTPDSAKTNTAPLIFVFHGHGGTSANAARSFHLQREWPEAIVIYPQGLNTPGKLTDPEGKRSGWQRRGGDQGDRDLKFFDAMLDALKKDYRVDGKRIYCTGHSNGGAFTYLLWDKRGDVLAAVAPSASAASLVEAVGLKPKPVMHLAGEKDDLVKFEWQRKTMEWIRKVNGCDPKGEPWQEVCTLYPSRNGGPVVVTYIHKGGHGFPAEAPTLIAKFFKDQQKR